MTMGMDDRDTDEMVHELDRRDQWDVNAGGKDGCYDRRRVANSSSSSMFILDVDVDVLRRKKRRRRRCLSESEMEKRGEDEEAEREGGNCSYYMRNNTSRRRPRS